MISYDLAKRLKDAGFPQKGNGYVILNPLTDKEIEEGFDAFSEVPVETKEDIYIPTLSELIEALGNDFYQLEKTPVSNWKATGTKNGLEYVSYEGLTGIEAVALLYLKLKEKGENDPNVV